MAKIQIEVTDLADVKHVAKITGAPAAAWVDTINQWLATQTDTVTDANGVTTQVPKYANAAVLVKRNAVDIQRSLAPQFPSATLAADVAEITAKIAALEAKRKALFDAALTEV